VAVLAFANLSGDAAQEYFSDGLADELTNTLSRIEALQVAARTSAFTFKGGSATVGQIARALNVAAVLEGSVRREGQHVRINIELISAATEKSLWSYSYDDDLSGIMALQARIATAVAGSLQARLLGDEPARLAMGGTRNPAALDAYLRGLNFYEGEKSAQALAAFDEAIALDPGFALAHAHRSLALRFVVDDAVGNPDPAWIERLERESVAAAQRAVALAPDLAAGYRALAAALQESRFDFKGAAAAFEHARRLAPGDVLTAYNYAFWQVRTGHDDEALRIAEWAVSIDPLSPTRYQDLSAIQLATRHDEAALATLRHAIRIRGHATDIDLAGIGEVEYLRGDPRAALEACKAGTSWFQVFVQAMAYHALGRTAEASAALSKLREELGVSGAFQYAEIYAQWGQLADAQHWLDAAYQARDPGLIDVTSTRELEPLRETAGYKTLINRMAFPT
jgi:TolB-like protein